MAGAEFGITYARWIATAHDLCDQLEAMTPHQKKLFLIDNEYEISRLRYYLEN